MKRKPTQKKRRNQKSAVNRTLRGEWKMKKKFIFSLAIFLGLGLGIFMGRSVEWIQVASSHDERSGLNLDFELYQLDERIKKLEELFSPLDERIKKLEELFSPSLAPFFDFHEPVVFLKISAGNFLMGTPDSEAKRTSNEGPQHLVTLTRSFEIQRTEVTQWHWFSVMGNNPSRFASSSHCPQEHVILQGTALCPNHPVERVSWNDTQTFLSLLNARVREEEGYSYRLPTEAEWEYATRAGTQTAYSFGNDVNELNQYGWYSSNSGGQTQAVASLRPNPWGLYDVHGNVREWVQDRGNRTYTSSSVTNPLRTSGSNPALRGGAWNRSAQILRSMDRHTNPSDGRSINVGFRLVRTKN